ncbi:hypothetical protein [Streptomyces nigrescens]|uniref:hypothetical protein n=1 Tax=Streptomyces nigrescens TaxID=1920 RepID=UPI00347C10FC
MGPTPAMGLNGVGVAATVGKAMPLVFLRGLLGVRLVSHGFWPLTQHFHHAGSVYAWRGLTPPAPCVAPWPLPGTPSPTALSSAQGGPAG